MSTLHDEDWGSDSSDEDYVPAAASDDDYDEYDADLVPEDETNADPGKLKKDKGKKEKKSKCKRPKKRGLYLEEEKTAEEQKEEETHSKELAEQIQKEKTERIEEAEKKKADDLWASFMSDVKTVRQPKPAASTPQTQRVGSGLGSLCNTKKTPKSSTIATAAAPSSSPAGVTTPSPAAKPATVTVTKEFDFAGETVKITKEVSADSKEAKSTNEPSSAPTSGTPSRMPLPGMKRTGGSGLGSVLGKISKKPKISTLDKSKLDWESFKNKEGISEELDLHNKGRQGYLERKAFLERTDQRQFEIEKDLRLSSSKR